MRAVFCFAAVLACADLAAAADAPKVVLMLSEYRPDTPSNIGRERIVRTTLAQHYGGMVEFYAEYIDSPAFPEAEYRLALHDFLGRKYEHKPLDAVIAIGRLALDFAAANSSDLFHGVPIVATGVDREAIEAAQQRALAGGVIRKLDPRGTVDFILRLQPATRQVVVIAAGADAEYFRSLTQQALHEYESSIGITFLIGLPMEELLARVGKFTDDTAILYLAVYEDGAGRRFLPTEALASIVQAASVPVYGIIANYLDYGIVGGSLHDADALSREVAQLTVEELRRGRSAEVPIRESNATLPMANWRELRHWGLSEASLPAHTVVLYKDRGAWELYQWYVISAVTLTALEATIIISLLVQRGRRRRAENAAKASEAALRGSYERIRHLTGRLITAQEAERTRIARDLHDDVCQELAGASLAISGLSQQRGGLQDANVQEALGGLKRRALSLAGRVRNLSHDLHPGTLQQVGLAAALEGHCIEVEQQYDVQVSFNAVGDIRHVGHDAALCLFRISQEALRNAATHGARRIALSVLRSDDDLELAVADDGRGFDLVAVRQSGSGLGLVSMEERAHLLGGQLHITAEPQKGTTIRVRVPMSRSPETVQDGDDEVAASEQLVTASLRVSGEPT